MPSLKKINEAKEAARLAAQLGSADLAETAEKPAIPKNKKAVEKRTSKVGSYLRPSEKKQYLNLIGRKSESDAVRDLVLDFIKKGESL